MLTNQNAGINGSPTTSERFPDEPIDHGRRRSDSFFGGLDDLAAARLAPAARPLPRRAEAACALAESLSFTIRLVTCEMELSRVQALRAAAYGRHMPNLADAFGADDPIDLLPDTTIFFAEDKASGQLVGSCRIQTNRHAPLQIEHSLELPPARQGQLLAEITRLTVLPGYAPPVKLALVKASHIFCIAMQIGGVLAGSRRSLLRQYRNLGFRDLFEDERMVPLKHAGGLEHRILFRDTVTSEAESRSRNHPDHSFVFRTYHPDIMIFEPVAHSVSQGLRPARVQRNWALAA